MTHKNTSLIIAGCLMATIVSIRFAVAQSQDDWRNVKEKIQPQLKLDQDYTGTKPGNGNRLPKVEELKGKDGLWITWPGFMMTDNGGSRVFLQTTGPLQYKMKIQKKKIVLTFKNTRIHLSNNKNPLVTLHFNTPVARINLKKRQKNSELILNLKTESTPSVSQTTDADGYNYLFVDFAPGQYPLSGPSDARPTFNSSTNENMNSDEVPDDMQE